VLYYIKSVQKIKKIHEKYLMIVNWFSHALVQTFSGQTIVGLKLYEFFVLYLFVYFFLSTLLMLFIIVFYICLLLPFLPYNSISSRIFFLIFNFVVSISLSFLHFFLFLFLILTNSIPQIIFL
jgi:hypothetical protein